MNNSKSKSKQWSEIKSDPEKHAEYTAKNNARCRAITMADNPKLLKQLERRRKYARDYMNRRRATMKESDPIRYEALLNKDREASKAKSKIEHYRKRQLAWAKNKRDSNLSFRILGRLRNSLNSAIKFGGSKRSHSAAVLLGCSIEDFKKHIQSNFIDGMTWDNWGVGSGRWHIDHIRPCASFDFSKTKDQFSCFNFLNMRPLWSHLNISKGSVYNGIRYLH